MRRKCEFIDVLMLMFKIKYVIPFLYSVFPPFLHLFFGEIIFYDVFPYFPFTDIFTKTFTYSSLVY